MPAAAPTRTRYDVLTRSLHWLVAGLVIVIYATGLGREALPKGEPRNLMLGLHMSLGLALVGLMVLRMGWRIAAPAVAPVPMARSVEVAARLGHAALYVLLFAAPLAGLAAAWLKGRSVGFFGMPLPTPFDINISAARILEEVHEGLANGLLILAGLHAAAAIAHHHGLKDGTLRRMLPRLR